MFHRGHRNTGLLGSGQDLTPVSISRAAEAIPSRIDPIEPPELLLGRMLGELVRDAQTPDGATGKSPLRKQLENGAPETAHQGVLLGGDDPLDLFGRVAEQLLIEGLDEPGVDHPDGEPFLLQEFGGGQGGIDAGADSDDGERGIRRIEENLALSDGNGPGLFVQRDADSPHRADNAGKLDSRR